MIYFSPFLSTYMSLKRDFFNDRKPLQEVFLFVNFQVVSLMIIVFTLNVFFSVTS